MASQHQVSTAANGAEFMSLDSVTVHRQYAPKIAKNGRPYSGVTLKSAGHETRLSLWDDASKWKLPVGVSLTLRGKFTRDDFGGKISLTCDELTPPEGAVEFTPEEIAAEAARQLPGEAMKPSMQACLDAGLRAVKYVEGKNRPDLSAAAFAFAANALLQGVRLE